jgi:hypothetical protein
MRKISENHKITSEKTLRRYRIFILRIQKRRIKKKKKDRGEGEFKTLKIKITLIFFLIISSIFSSEMFRISYFLKIFNFFWT